MIRKKKKLLEVKNLHKAFVQGDNVIAVLKNAEFSLYEKEVVALVGPSGCGKTTFLHIVGLLDAPDKGEIVIGDQDFTKASDTKRTLCRKDRIGFVYQAHNLLSDFTVFGNVMLPMRLRKISFKKAREKAIALLAQLGLSKRLDHYPSQLSGGEQQRVAIARSLIHDPQIIFADEPTGNLDRDNAEKVLDVLIPSVKKLCKSMVIVTHNKQVADRADRIVTIEKGKLVSS